MEKSRDLNSLQKLRISKNITQLEMAKKLNLATSTYNMYENNKRKIPFKVCENICNILNVQIEQIFKAETLSIK